jgi:hypothetical protein
MLYVTSSDKGWCVNREILPDPLSSAITTQPSEPLRDTTCTAPPPLSIYSTYRQDAR